MRFPFLVAVLAGLPVVASPAPLLTLARVQQLAVENQPSLTALQAEVRAGRESALAEAQLPDPRLKIGMQNVPTDTFALNQEPMTQTMVAIEQMIPGGDKRALRQRRAQAEADQAAAELAAQRRLVRRDAAVAFVNLLGARQQLDLIKALQNEAARQVEAARIGNIAGKAAQSEVLATRQMLTLARDRESELAMQAEKARADLARWIGAAADDEPADSQPEVLNAMPPTLAELEQRIDAHPSHAAVAGSLAVAAADLALAREATRPDKSIEIGYGRRASRFGDMVSIQFAMDLPLFPKERQDRGVAARLAKLERADAMQEDHLRMLRAEVAAVHAEWQFSRERLARIDRELLPDAQARGTPRWPLIGPATASWRASSTRAVPRSRPGLRASNSSRRPRVRGSSSPISKTSGNLMNTSTRLILTAVVSAAVGATGYALYMRSTSHADAGKPATAVMPPRPPRASAAFCTGTTRWCRRAISTSRASRRSWTWIWCPSTPTTPRRGGRRAHRSARDPEHGRPPGRGGAGRRWPMRSAPRARCVPTTSAWWWCNRASPVTSKASRCAN